MHSKFKTVMAVICLIGIFLTIFTSSYILWCLVVLLVFIFSMVHLYTVFKKGGKENG